MQHFVFLSLLTTRQSVQNRHKHEVTAYQINNSFRKFFLFSSLNRYTRKESDTYKVVSWQEFHLHLQPPYKICNRRWHAQGGEDLQGLEPFSVPFSAKCYIIRIMLPFLMVFQSISGKNRAKTRHSSKMLTKYALLWSQWYWRHISWLLWWWLPTARYKSHRFNFWSLRHETDIVFLYHLRLRRCNLA